MPSRGASWLRLSDTGSETAGGGAAALVLAGFDRLASAGRIELRRGVLAVVLRASRAGQGSRHPPRDARRGIKADLAPAPDYSDSPLVARLGHHQPNERLLVDIDLTPLVRRKMGWRVERDRRELEDAFGLDHFEGRT